MTAQDRLEAFLKALVQLERSLPADVQKQLNNIGNTLAEDLTASVEKLDDFARNYPPLAPLYENECVKVLKEATERNKSKARPILTSDRLSTAIGNSAIDAIGILRDADSVAAAKKAAKGGLLQQIFSFFKRNG